ncbi:phosphotransferase family protein [Paenibacillus sp. GCM10023252]|uniref:phosphotransferase family protein n=1 Tax=Paenibacillus sp. GCM10023252 TaxID=3252649 RepID=UPI003622FA9C
MQVAFMKPDGTMDNALIYKREILYTGMNGKHVERVYTSPDQSYIFKPLTNLEQHKLEGWIGANILPSIPGAPAPRLLASSDDGVRPEESWLLYEDLGSLEHVFDVDTAAQLAVSAARWHALPCAHLRELPLRGPKPPVAQLAAQLRRADSAAHARRLLQGMPAAHAERALAVLEGTGSYSWEGLPDVLSHGDLHLGNYAKVNGAVKVMDWEHLHLNHPYWDLYHVIDLSHPSFPKNVTSEARERILGAYAAEAEALGTLQQSYMDFSRGYREFAVIFTMWMLQLIRSDLERGSGPWPEEQLRRQLGEAEASLAQCVEDLL